MFFKHGKGHVAVEVKSIRSMEADIVRSMFQCVKYRAVLEAQQAAHGIPQNARAILVLEGKLPKNLRAMKNIIAVELIEDITPIGRYRQKSPP